jgi:hypothetical protein
MREILGLPCTVSELRIGIPGELSISGSDSPHLGAASAVGPTVEANEPLFLSPTGNLDAPNRINAANNQVCIPYSLRFLCPED